MSQVTATISQLRWDRAAKELGKDEVTKILGERKSYQPACEVTLDLTQAQAKKIEPWLNPQAGGRTKAATPQPTPVPKKVKRAPKAKKEPSLVPGTPMPKSVEVGSETAV